MILHIILSAAMADDEFTRARSEECRWSHNSSMMGSQQGFKRMGIFWGGFVGRKVVFNVFPLKK